MRASVIRASIAIAIVLTFPSMGSSQTPGTNLVVQTNVTAVSMHGDTAYVTYVLRNDAGSAERLFRFMVDAPSPALYLSLPTPSGGWTSGKAFGGRSVAAWAALGQRMLPGQESPPLTQRAIGLPTIVTTWVTGYTPPSEEIPSDTLPLEDPPSVADSSVGVEPFPVDRGAANLLLRERGLLDQSCGSLAWVSDTLACATLRNRLEAASQAVGQGNTALARSAVEGFLSDLGAQHGPGLPVNDNAFWLLKVNAEYILTRL